MDSNSLGKKTSDDHKDHIHNWVPVLKEEDEDIVCNTCGGCGNCGRCAKCISIMEPWMEAKSWMNLAKCNIRFIKGEIKHPECSTQFGHFSYETTDFCKQLCAINANGFLTMVSKPGVTINYDGSCDAKMRYDKMFTSSYRAHIGFGIPLINTQVVLAELEKYDDISIIYGMCAKCSIQRPCECTRLFGRRQLITKRKWKMLKNNMCLYDDNIEIKLAHYLPVLTTVMKNESTTHKGIPLLFDSSLHSFIQKIGHIKMSKKIQYIMIISDVLGDDSRIFDILEKISSKISIYDLINDAEQSET